MKSDGVLDVVRDVNNRIRVGRSNKKVNGITRVKVTGNWRTNSKRTTIHIPNTSTEDILVRFVERVSSRHSLEKVSRVTSRNIDKCPEETSD